METNAFDVIANFGFAYQFGMGIAALGVAVGLGMLIGKAMESMGRQPEAINDIRGAMIVGAAFVEGIIFFVLISPFILAFASALLPLGE